MPVDDEPWPKVPTAGATKPTVVGLPPADVEALERGCARWFEATAGADRRGVAAALAGLVAPPSPRQPPVEVAAAEQVIGLLPEGVPEGFVVLHAPTSRGGLERLEAAGRIVRRNGRWRHLCPPMLEADPLHAAVAGLLEPSDPRRLVHQALSGADPEPLLDELDGALERMATHRVRQLLEPVEPRAVGRETARRHAQACLLELDPAAAGRVLEPWWKSDDPWCAAVSWARDQDHDPDRGAVAAAPHAWLGAALAAQAAREAAVEPVLAQLSELLSGAPGRCAALVAGDLDEVPRGASTAERVLAVVRRCGTVSGRRLAVRLERVRRMCVGLGSGAEAPWRCARAGPGPRRAR